jgi:hypothetical protein
LQVSWSELWGDWKQGGNCSDLKGTVSLSPGSFATVSKCTTAHPCVHRLVCTLSSANELSAMLYDDCPIASYPGPKVTKNGCSVVVVNGNPSPDGGQCCFG